MYNKLPHKPGIWLIPMESWIWGEFCFHVFCGACCPSVETERLSYIGCCLLNSDLMLWYVSAVQSVTKNKDIFTKRPQKGLG